MKALVVYNKKSGLMGSFNYVDLTKKTLEGQCDKVELYEICDWSGDIFKTYKDSKFDLVVAIGGDGTVRTCATLILNHMPNAALRIVPTGSTNVLAFSLGGGLNILKSIQRLNYLHRLKEIRIDVGRLNGREYFLEALMIGYLAEVVAKTEQNMKNKMGFGGYLMTFFKNRKCPKYIFKLIIDGNEHEAMASTLMVINALSVFGLKIRKRVEFSDGVFEIGFAKYDTILGFLWKSIPFFLFKKSKVITWLEGKEIKIVQCDDQPLAEAQVDGDKFDRMGENELVVEVLPRRLKVLV